MFFVWLPFTCFLSDCQQGLTMDQKQINHRIDDLVDNAGYLCSDAFTRVMSRCATQLFTASTFHRQRKRRFSLCPRSTFPTKRIRAQFKWRFLTEIGCHFDLICSAGHQWRASSRLRSTSGTGPASPAHDHRITRTRSSIGVFTCTSVHTSLYDDQVLLRNAIKTSQFLARCQRPDCLCLCFSVHRVVRYREDIVQREENHTRASVCIAFSFYLN
jgi:hypothetical protein